MDFVAAELEWDGEAAARDRLHVEARALVAAGRAAGRRFDRKMLRFNDLVATALGYGALASDGSDIDAVCLAGLAEAVECCDVDDPLYVKGRGPLTLLAPFRGTSR